MPRRSSREEIVAAALEQFHTLGFNAAGVKGIVDAAGVPKGSFYNHFESKETLALVALDQYGAGRGLAELADESVEPLTRLRAHFEFLRDEILAYDYTRGCLIGNFGAEIADHSSAIRAGVQQGFDRWGSLIAAAIAQAQHAGTVRADLDPASTARFVLNAWEGTLIAVRAQRSGDSVDAFFDLVFGTLLTAERP